MKFYVTSQKSPERFDDYGFIDSKTEYKFDFSQWAEEFGTVTTVTWTVQSGQAIISGQALASNIATALITMSQPGNNLIQVKATNGTETVIANLYLAVKDPQSGTDAYGF